MSLENEIKNLTIAIEKLTAIMGEKEVEQVIETPKAETPKAETPKPETPKPEKLDHQALKDLCLSKVSDAEDKNAMRILVRTKLKEYGVSKVNDLAEDKIEEVYNQVSQL
jgi:hypothetical protein